MIKNILNIILSILFFTSGILAQNDSIFLKVDFYFIRKHRLLSDKPLKKCKIYMVFDNNAILIKNKKTNIIPNTKDRDVQLVVLKERDTMVNIEELQNYIFFSKNTYLVCGINKKIEDKNSFYIYQLKEFDDNNGICVNCDNKKRHKCLIIWSDKEFWLNHKALFLHKSKKKIISNRYHK